MPNSNSNINSKTLQKEEVFHPQKVFPVGTKALWGCHFPITPLGAFGAARLPLGSAVTGTTALDPYSITKVRPFLHIKTSLLSTL